MTALRTTLHLLITTALLVVPACDGDKAAAKKGDAKKDDAKKSDAKKDDAKKSDAKKSDAKQGDAKQGDAKQGDAKQDDSKAKADAKAVGGAEAGDTPPAPVDPKTLLDDEGHYSYGHDAFGELSASMTDKDLIKLLGEPKKKDERFMEEATGDIVQTWSYEDQGLTIGMYSSTMKGPQSVSTITVAKPSTLKTKLGIGIGSKRADVIAAYGAFKDEEMPDSPESFIAGSIYGGLIIDFTDGVVSQMFMGAGAE